MGYKNRKRQKSYLHSHYIANKDAYYNRSRTRFITLRNFLREVKEKNPCNDCGEFFPYFVMEFDHTSSNKIATISNLMKCRGLVAVLREIQKCDIVCGNCHSYRGEHRRNSIA